MTTNRRTATPRRRPLSGATLTQDVRRLGRGVLPLALLPLVFAVWLSAGRLTLPFDIFGSPDAHGGRTLVVPISPAAYPPVHAATVTTAPLRRARTATLRPPPSPARRAAVESSPAPSVGPPLVRVTTRPAAQAPARIRTPDNVVGHASSTSPAPEPVDPPPPVQAPPPPPAPPLTLPVPPLPELPAPPTLPVVAVPQLPEVPPVPLPTAPLAPVVP